MAHVSGMMKNGLADKLNLPVHYRGVTGTKQHGFSIGTQFVNRITGTLEEAVAQWGQRIKVDEKSYALLADYRQGMADTKYSPRPQAKTADLLAYGMGYLKRLLSQNAPAPAKPIVKATPVATKPPAPTPPRPPAPRTSSNDKLVAGLRNRVKRASAPVMEV